MANAPNTNTQIPVLQSVDKWDGTNPAQLPHFIDSLEQAFTFFPNLSNTAKATAAALKFGFNTPARQWYDITRKNEQGVIDVDVWEKQTEQAAVGNPGDPNYRTKVEKKLVGLKQALEDKWPVGKDLQSLLRLQEQNSQRPGEYFAAWSSRVQFNQYRLYEGQFDLAIRTSAEGKQIFPVFLSNEIKLKANPLLRKVFEDLDEGKQNFAGYTAAATAWESTEEGRAWLNSQPKAQPATAQTNAVRSAPNPPSPDEPSKKGWVCNYCGITESHKTEACYRRQNDIAAGKVQEHVDGYPLTAKPRGRSRRNKPQGNHLQRGNQPGHVNSVEGYSQNHPFFQQLARDQAAQRKQLIEHWNKHGPPPTVVPPPSNPGPQRPAPPGPPALQWQGGQSAAVSAYPGPMVPVPWMGYPPHPPTGTGYLGPPHPPASALHLYPHLGQPGDFHHEPNRPPQE